MPKPKSDATPHALFHVSTKTGERVRYPRHSFPAVPENEARTLAQWSRTSGALGQAHQDEWETQTHPEVAESQLHERRRKAKKIVSRLIDLPVL